MFTFVTLFVALYIINIWGSCMQTLKRWGSSSLLTKYLDSENTSRLPRNFKIAAKYYFQIKHIHGCVEFNDLLGILYVLR